MLPGLGRSPGGGSGNPLQYSCLGNSMDSGAWWAAVHGVAKSQTGLKGLGRGISSSRSRATSGQNGELGLEQPQSPGLAICQGGLCSPLSHLLPTSALSFLSLSSVPKWSYLANQTSDLGAKYNPSLKVVFLVDCKALSSFMVGAWLISCSACHKPEWE